VSPGCARVAVQPHLADLKYAKGTFPTPCGIIKIEHMRADGEVVTGIEAPDGIEIVR